MMDYKDYYKLLGVDRKATEKEIKTAYRKLARELHPDVNPGDKKSEQRFQEINEAYEVLSDAENRKKYDTMGQYWNQAGAGRGGGGGGTRTDINLEDLLGNFASGGGGGGESGFSSFFDRFFSQRRQGRPDMQQQASSSPPATADIEVSLEECFTGTTRTLEMSQEVACSVCGGSGVSGSSLCRNCRGSGRQRSVRQLEVRIPAGVTNGSKVKASDVVLTVKVQADKDYEIKGRDLTRHVPVKLYDAVLGSEVAFKTPQGKNVTLKIPAETQNGRQFRLTGQGLPGAGGKPAGDLYVKVEIQIPSQLSAREKELFQELAALRNEKT